MKCYADSRITSFTHLEYYCPKQKHPVCVLIFYTYSSVDSSPSSMSGIVRKSMFSLGKLRLANVVKSEFGYCFHPSRPCWHVGIPKWAVNKVFKSPKTKKKKRAAYTEIFKTPLTHKFKYILTYCPSIRQLQRYHFFSEVDVKL